MPIKDNPEAAVSSSPDTLPSLESLQTRIDSAKLLIDSDNNNDSSEDAPKDMGDAMRIGIELVSGVAVGGASGYFLDQWAHTMPLFFIIGFLLGAAAGFTNMVREARRKN